EMRVSSSVSASSVVAMNPPLGGVWSDYRGRFSSRERAESRARSDFELRVSARHVVGWSVETGGVHGCLCASFHPELGAQVRDIVLDGLLGQVHLHTDLAVRHALGDEREDAALLVRQTREALVFVRRDAKLLA